MCFRCLVLLEMSSFDSIHVFKTVTREFIRHRRSQNSPATTQNSPAKFRLFPERASLFHNNSPVTLYCSPAKLQFLMKSLRNTEVCNKM